MNIELTQREILFRGKRIDNDEWTLGFYFREAGSFIKELPSSVTTQVHLVDPDTVGQYTGLKDRNGKMIFEGDIVEARDIDEKHIAPIVFRERFFVFDESGFVRLGIGTYKSKLFKIIGNIHDNPELLEQKP